MEKTCLICIDGWGVPTKAKGDAITAASTPVMEGLARGHSYCELSAHGLAVGLPAGLMGNSEVGHLNIGAGRVVFQDIVRIELAVEQGELVRLDAVKGAMAHCLAGTGRLHLVGLVSDGGVHSHIRHLFALLKVAKEAGIPNTFVHFFGDGRDTR